MKLRYSILASGLVLSLLVTTVACNRHEFFRIGKGIAPDQILHIGIYVDPQQPTKCDVTFPVTNVRKGDVVQWDAIDSHEYKIHFPPPSGYTAGTPFGAGKDTFDDGKKTPTPQVPAGTYHAYEIFLDDNLKSPCKLANDPNGDPGLKIKN